MSEPSLADSISEGLERGREPDWRARDPKQWAVALEALARKSELAAAVWGADALTSAYPEVRLFQKLAAYMRSAPEPVGDALYDGFRDDPALDVQVVRRQGATEALFVFTGILGGAGMPITVIHRWFGMLKMHVVYLRDLNRAAYNHGVRSLGPDCHSAFSGLSAVADGLGARAILTYGNSIGGYGALRYGLELGARFVTGFSAITSMAPPLAPIAQLNRRELPVGPDLRPMYVAGRAPARTLLVYGEACAPDGRHARNLANAPGVTLETLDDCPRHEAALCAIVQGRFRQLLERMVAA